MTFTPKVGADTPMGMLSPTKSACVPVLKYGIGVANGTRT